MIWSLDIRLQRCTTGERESGDVEDVGVRA